MRRTAKFVTITNGVDLDDFHNVAQSPKNRPGASRVNGPQPQRNRFVLTYAGRFTTECIAPPLLQGLSQFVGWLGQRATTFELRIVGQVSPPLRHWLTARHVPHVACGYVAHRRAVSEMVASDVLLAAIADETNAETVILGKVFEYLASGRPILMVAPPLSATRELVSRCQAGVTVDLDSEAIRDALIGLWNQWSAGTLPSGCPPHRLAPYTRRHLTGRLAGVLEAVRTGRESIAVVT